MSMKSFFFLCRPRLWRFPWDRAKSSEHLQASQPELPPLPADLALHPAEHHHPAISHSLCETWWAPSGSGGGGHLLSPRDVVWGVGCEQGLKTCIGEFNLMWTVPLLDVIWGVGCEQGLKTRGYYLETDPDPIAMVIRVEIYTYMPSETSTNWHCMVTDARQCYRSLLSAGLVDE